MAAKIKPFLQTLLSPNQTGFLKQRNILHGFHYAQHVLQSATRQRVQIAVLKADICKAFDTLDWKFMLNILTARGFPHACIQQIRNSVLRGSSRIIINSVAGRTITLKRGVRQGDPVSPYLFNLAMDFLSTWMQSLTDLNFLTPPFPQCKPCLLYADDTLILLKPTRSQILKVKLVLDVFGSISGLKVNSVKSELAITSPHPSQTCNLAEVIRCKHTTFPIHYLGLPLSDKNLTKPDYLPIINKIQKMLQGWKASLLTIGGRMVLTNAVLTAIPNYFMSVFMLPTWVINKIDQIRKRFFWHGHKEQQRQMRSLYMVSWIIATKPKDQGGLGIRDIRTANQALLMKWMWNWHDLSQSWWKQPSQMAQEKDRPWNDPHSSHFWKSLNRLSPAFTSSVKHQIRDGRGTSFWHDNWHGTPLKYDYPNFYDEVRDKHASLQQCLDANSPLSQLQLLSPMAQSEKDRMMLEIERPSLTQGKDFVTWLRSPNGFSVKSAYYFLSHTPTPTTTLHNIWSIKAPPRITIFTWLLLTNRLATIDNLVKRGWQLPNMCMLCNGDEETAQHIVQQCSLAKQIRNYLHSTISFQQTISPKFITANSVQVLTDPAETLVARQWELLTCFILWRERCRRVFSDKIATQIELVREIRSEFKSCFSL